MFTTVDVIFVYSESKELSRYVLLHFIWVKMILMMWWILFYSIKCHLWESILETVNYIPIKCCTEVKRNRRKAWVSTFQVYKSNYINNKSLNLANMNWEEITVITMSQCVYMCGCIKTMGKCIYVHLSGDDLGTIWYFLIYSNNNMVDK